MVTQVYAPAVQDSDLLVRLLCRDVHRPIHQAIVAVLLRSRAPPGRVPRAPGRRPNDGSRLPDDVARPDPRDPDRVGRSGRSEDVAGGTTGVRRGRGEPRATGRHAMTVPNRQRRRAKGEGGIRKRPDRRWEWSMRLPDGARKTVYGRTKQDAATELRKALHHRDTGLPPEDGRLTARELPDRWLTSQRSADRSANTVDNYSWAVARISAVVGRVQLTRLGPDDVEGFLRAEVPCGLSRSSLRRLHNVFEVFEVFEVALRFRERRGLVARDGRQRPHARSVSRRAHRPSLRGRRPRRRAVARGCVARA